MPALESLKPAEWKRVKEIDETYGQAKKFYASVDMSRGAFKSLARTGKGLPVTITKAREAFEKLDGPNDITASAIIEIVAAEWGIGVEELRRGKIALARQAAAYLLEKETDLKNKEIAAELGYSDHTGVLVALESIGNRMDTEAAVRRRMYSLRAKIQNP